MEISKKFDANSDLESKKLHLSVLNNIWVLSRTKNSKFM